jgi:hypothetical protein
MSIFDSMRNKAKGVCEWMILENGVLKIGIFWIPQENR